MSTLILPPVLLIAHTHTHTQQLTQTAIHTTLWTKDIAKCTNESYDQQAFNSDLFSCQLRCSGTTTTGMSCLSRTVLWPVPSDI